MILECGLGPTDRSSRFALEQDAEARRRSNTGTAAAAAHTADRRPSAVASELLSSRGGATWGTMPRSLISSLYDRKGGTAPLATIVRRGRLGGARRSADHRGELGARRRRGGGGGGRGGGGGTPPTRRRTPARPRPRSAPRRAPGELLRVEARVLAAARDQLGVRAPLDQPPALEHEDHVRGEDRRQPVRDRDRRPPSITGSSAVWTSRSLPVSSADVASSRISTGGFFSTTRAIASRCFSPPDMR